MAMTTDSSLSSSPVPVPMASAAIWNPNAAAGWSLLLSLPFGAYLHMRNWEALQETKRARTAKAWLVAFLGMFGAYVLFRSLYPDSETLSTTARGIYAAYFLLWYFIAGRDQVKYVKARFGNSYVRKRWGKTLACGFLAMIGIYVVAAYVVASIFLFLIHLIQLK